VRTLALVFAGCAQTHVQPATEVLVVVNSDLEIGTQLNRLHVQVKNKAGDSTSISDERNLALVPQASKEAKATGPYKLPLSFSVVPPKNGNDSRFRIIVTGLLGDQEVVEQQVIVTFQPGKTTLLPVFLSVNCFERLCREEQHAGQDVVCAALKGQCDMVPTAMKLATVDPKMSPVNLVQRGASAAPTTVLGDGGLPKDGGVGAAGMATSGIAAGAGGFNDMVGAGGMSALAAARCGDGQVTGIETCDISIDPGKPGACPIDCPDLGMCSHRKLNGSGCQATCVVLQASCKGGDGCCPAGCSNGVDSDCSASCHDGIVQPDKGETCEPMSKTMPCKTLADCDDKDPCTTDTLTGSADNCNADCLHTEITMPSVSVKDGCCPQGANNNTDIDCAPHCGNGVVEMGENCDGSPGCASDCKSSSLSLDQQRCLQQYATDACERCSCMNCAGMNQYLACREVDQKAGNNKCNAVLACARKSNCAGTPCYCGDANTVTCAIGPAMGPCAAEIESAAGAAPGDYYTVNAQQQMAGTPLFDAYTTDMCRVTNCKTECR
jgi:hypothetical protein